MGPSIQSSGVPLAGRMEDPTLELYDGNGALLTSNDNWKDSPQRAQIEASGIAPGDDKEAAIVRSLGPGAYTAILRGKNDSTGIALVEVYDRGLSTNSVLANISSRCFVEASDNVLIGGFIAGNHTGNTTVLVRAIGPSISSQVSNALQDPTLSLHDQNGLAIASNDNWRDSSQQADIQATGIAPSDNREAAVLATVPPAGYTAIVRGNNNTVGVGAVEIYNLR
jgi:hypothetical protein